MKSTGVPRQPPLPLFRSGTPGEGLIPDRVRGASGWIEFGYRRSRRRRTVGVEVHPDGRVVVAAPPGVAVADLRRFVREREQWIAKWRHRFAEIPQTAEESLVAGQRVPYLGDEWTLAIREGARESVALLRGRVQIRTGDPTDLEAVGGLLDAWYRAQPLQVLPERFERGWRRHFRSLPLPRLTIRKMKTRWGSCNPKGRISLNQELIKMPLGCIDYVVIHELCHLRVPNHSPRFWTQVERLMPDYRRWRERLNRPGG